MEMPLIGQKVRIWPMPGRRVQQGDRPVDWMGGGRWMPDEGMEVVWSYWHVQAYQAGDILLTNPNPQPPTAQAEPIEMPWPQPSEPPGTDTK